MKPSPAQHNIPDLSRSSSRMNMQSKLIEMDGGQFPTCREAEDGCSRWQMADVDFFMWIGQWAVLFFPINKCFALSTHCLLMASTLLSC
ncbi:hypothetical protein V6N13_078630 [Hibiscus sabdariffa]|uniref:Uncharacterized protein n=1 Tax=Hibiscus sabdariffa TaxID=183260 RepID=A0ABR2RP29_9ROSI